MNEKNTTTILLHNAETRLDAASWSGQFGFWEWDLVAERVHWLNDWCATLDIDPCPAEGHEYYWNQRRHPLDRAKVEAAWVEHRSGHTEWFEVEYRVLTRGGQWRWIGERGKIVARDAAGEPLRMIGACFDIHQRRGVEASLKRQQQFLETICDSVPAWLVITDLDGRIEFLNRAIDGITSEQAIGRLLQDLLASANRRHIEQGIRAVISTRTSRNQSLVTGRRGSSRHFECRIAPVLTDGEVTQLAAVAVEVTDRRQLERAVIDIANHEQERLSRDLHDGLGQELFGISLLLRGLLVHQPALAPEVHDQIDEIIALAGKALTTTRSLARGLAAISCGYMGLVEALKALGQRLAASTRLSIACEFGARSSADLEEGIADQLYRIGQEALTNAVRHSGASEIHLRLYERNGEINLEVQDDGVGIASGRIMGEGLGTRIMIYRAESIGATMVFESLGSGGAVIRCRYPLPERSVGKA